MVHAIPVSLTEVHAQPVSFKPTFVPALHGQAWSKLLGRREAPVARDRTLKQYFKSCWIQALAPRRSSCFVVMRHSTGHSRIRRRLYSSSPSSAFFYLRTLEGMGREQRCMLICDMTGMGWAGWWHTIPERIHQDKKAEVKGYIRDTGTASIC